MMQDWQPKLMEIEYLAHNGTDSEKEYYSKFGFEQMDWKDYQHINANKSDILEILHGEYDNRMIGLETMELWQYRLQTKYNIIAPKYERAFALYDEYADRMMQDVGDIVTRTLDEESSETINTDGTTSNTSTAKTDYEGNATSSASSSGSDSSTTNGTTGNLTQQTDTPDNLINMSDIGGEGGYAGMVTKENGSTTGASSSTNESEDSAESNDSSTTESSRNDSASSTSSEQSAGMRKLIERTEHNTDLMEQINENIDGWRNLIIRFVNEFAPLFLGVYFY